MKLKKTIKGLPDICDGQAACEAKSKELARVLLRALRKRGTASRFVQKVVVKFLCALRKGGVLGEADYLNNKICRRVDQTASEQRHAEALQLAVECDNSDDCELQSVYEAETSMEAQDFGSTVTDSVTDSEVQDVWGPGEGVDLPITGSISDKGAVAAPVPPATPSPSDDDGSGKVVGIVLGVIGGLLCVVAVAAVVTSKKKAAHFGGNLNTEYGEMSKEAKEAPSNTVGI